MAKLNDLKLSPSIKNTIGGDSINERFTEYTLKKYFIDTNVLIDNPNAVEILSDNKQNEVHIGYHVLNELDKLKKDPKIGYIITQVINQLDKHKDLFVLCFNNTRNCSNIDDILLGYCMDDPSLILVSNDKLLRLKADKQGIISQEFKNADPFIDTSNGDYSGVIKLENNEQLVENCFFWEGGKIWRHYRGQNYQVYQDNTAWGVSPRTFYQNLVFDLGLSEDIDVFTVQSAAGLGKTYLALALAFELVLNQKKYSKIYVTKAIYEIGEKLGFLPGDLDEKLYPYMKYLENLIIKLNKHKSLSEIYWEKGNKFNFTKKFEILPINYIRGYEIEDAFVIIDEVQNLSRLNVRTILSRMGENVKCMCIGDVEQIDNPHLNKHNNGLNWILKKFKGNPNYGHMRLKGNKYRGPICELVVKTDL